MKKIVALVSVLLSVVVPVQSNALEAKSLVIIDSYFDSRVSSPNFTCIVVTTNTNCKDVVTVFPTLLSNNINHGNAMVEVAKRQNPNIKVIGLVSAVSPTSDVNAGTFIEALKWVNNNSNTVGAVSLSRFFNGKSSCSPASVNTASYGGVIGADKQIKDLIDELNNKGIKVFASTGNLPKKTVDYPACIITTMSVTSPTNASDINTDFSADLVKVPLLGSNYLSTVFKSVPQTTSSATVAIAAQWITLGTLTGYTVKVYG